MTRHRFYVGLSQRNGNPVDAWDLARVDAMVSSLSGGYTVYEARGEWQGKTEHSRVYEVLGELGFMDIAQARDIARDIATIANQECVLYTHETVNAEFIGDGRVDHVTPIYNDPQED